MAIDIGVGATDRASNYTITNTRVDQNNPANATGTINVWEIWLFLAGSAVEVATFFVVSGDNLSTRDSELIGSVAAGSKQTFSGLSTDVQIGDYPGIYGSAGYIERDNSGANQWFYGADAIPSTNRLFSVQDLESISLYGTGTEAGGGWVNIAKVNGVASAAIAKMNGVAVAAIAKVNGVAV